MLIGQERVVWLHNIGKTFIGASISFHMTHKTYAETFFFFFCSVLLLLYLINWLDNVLKDFTLWSSWMQSKNTLCIIGIMKRHLSCLLKFTLFPKWPSGTHRREGHHLHTMKKDNKDSWLKHSIFCTLLLFLESTLNCLCMWNGWHK